MSRTILHPVNVALTLTHCFKNGCKNLKVAALAISTNEIRLPNRPFGQNRPNGAGVILNMNPIAHIKTVAIQLGAFTMFNACNGMRDEFLGMLVRTVVITAIGNRRHKPIRARPRSHQHIGRGLRAGVRTARPIRRILGKLTRVVKCQISKYLIGRDVVEAYIERTGSLKERIRAINIRRYKRRWVGNRIVIVRLGSVVDDGIMARNQSLEKLRIANVPHDKLNPIFRQPDDAIEICSVGKLIQNSNVHIGSAVHDKTDEGGSTKTATTRHKNIFIW